jgi:hypothetical protein
MIEQYKSGRMLVRVCVCVMMMTMATRCFSFASVYVIPLIMGLILSLFLSPVFLSNDCRNNLLCSCSDCPLGRDGDMVHRRSLLMSKNNGGREAGEGETALLLARNSK